MSWLQAIGIGLNVATAAHQYQQDRAMHRYKVQVSRARAKFQKGVAYTQAVLAEQQAEDVMRTGQIKHNLLSRNTAKAVSAARTAMAASGFKMDGGDFGFLEEDIRLTHREDTAELRRQTYRTQDLLNYRAKMIRYGADYNAQLASHDPGGPQLGGYFLQALSGGFQAYNAYGGK